MFGDLGVPPRASDNRAPRLPLAKKMNSDIGGIHAQVSLRSPRSPGSLRGRQAACGFVEQGTQPSDRRISLLVFVPLQILFEYGNCDRAPHHAQRKAPGHLVRKPRWQRGEACPRDFDPEDFAPDFESSDSEEGEDQDTGREHYVSVRFIFW